MNDRKPEVWRGFQAADNRGVRFIAEESPCGGSNATVVPDGAVMPLDESTNCVLEALFIWHADGSLAKLDAVRAAMTMFDFDRIAALDAARKGNQ